MDEMVVDGSVTRWDAETEIAVGEFIRSHIADRPAPEDAVFAIDFTVWADRLIDRGQVHLAALGAQRRR